MGLAYSVFLMLTTLYKYFLIGNIPWFVVQVGYIAIIGISLFWIFITGEVSRVSIAIKFIAIYLMPYILMLLESLLIWLLNQKGIEMIRRGIIPIAYQALQIIAIGAACMMLGKDAAFYTTIGFLLGNAAIVASVLVYRGVATGIAEMISFYTSMGDDDNLTSLSLEVHDLTFAMGLLIIYYVGFEKRSFRRTFMLALVIIFFMLGWKRSAIPGVVFCCAIAHYACKLPMNKVYRHVMVAGMLMILLAYLYIFIVRQGIIEWFSKSYDIDMMGRNEMWGWIEKYYVFSPTFMGQGIGFINEVMKEAIQSHTAALNHELSIHSDILARYIELGFVGNLIWSALTYMYTFFYIAKHHNFRAGIVYFSCLFFCYITYFTDNTVSYYHINLALRILPLSYAYSQINEIGDLLQQKDAFLATNKKRKLTI